MKFNLTNSKKLFKFIIATASTSILVTLASCKTVYLNGNHLDDNQVLWLKNSKPYKAEIIAKVGPASVVDNSTEYYISTRVETFKITPGKIVASRVVAVKFDSSGKTQLVEVYNDTFNNLNPVALSTEALGDKNNLLKEYASNFWRFNKSNKKNKTMP